MLKEVITIKKILFGITSLTLGGAERVLVDISNKLSEKYDITIFSIYDNGELKNDLNKNVKFKALYNCRYDELTKLQKMWIPIKILLFSKIIYNKKIKQNYDTEIAFLEGPITRLFSTKNKDVHKIAWIHNDIEKVFGNDLKSKIKKYIDKNLKNLLEEYVDNLALGIANIINILEPEAISIGGSMSHYEKLIFSRLKEKIYSGEYLFNKENPPKILTAQAGNDAGIVGATLIS